MEQLLAIGKLISTAGQARTVRMEAKSGSQCLKLRLQSSEMAESDCRRREKARSGDKCWRCPEFPGARRKHEGRVAINLISEPTSCRKLLCAAPTSRMFAALESRAGVDRSSWKGTITSPNVGRAVRAIVLRVGDQSI